MEILEGTVVIDVDSRLDRYIAENLGILTRSQLKARLVRAFVNGREVKLSRLVHDGDRFSLELEPEASRVELAEDLDLSVVYEDDSVIVVDKPQGMVTHPAHGNWQGTLANGLLGRFAAAREVAGPAGKSSGEPSGEPVGYPEGTQAEPSVPARAGIVHRLDKDTSGVIIAARNAVAQEFLAAQFRERSTSKLYYAIVKGRPPAASGRLDSWQARDPANRKRFAPSEQGRGKRAVTDWKLLGASGDYAFLALKPRTGRTHQLRVHCRQMGCPIVGDPVYAKKDARFPEATLMLHAAELRIIIPGESEIRCFSTPLPERFRLMMAALAFPGLHLP
ncbi:MAG: RluA family pseudouridine synthase [Spirochaetia bacterium]|jgi:23S rRNA pseudouridine1911/1915/1917 synthase|nr:RluA family pseudouridine synthase [Spirochaetia bacterium]